MVSDAGNQLHMRPKTMLEPCSSVPYRSMSVCRRTVDLVHNTYTHTTPHAREAGTSGRVAALAARVPRGRGLSAAGYATQLAPFISVAVVGDGVLSESL